jgi:hypothetical protein
MRHTRQGLLIAALVALVAAVPETAWSQAYQQTQLGQITSLYTGWRDDEVGVSLSVPLVNPGNCANTVAYFTSVSIADSENQKAALMIAYALQKPVSLAISGCTGQNYPQIIGLSLPQ